MVEVTLALGTLAIATLISTIISQKFKLPAVMILILLGSLFGPSGLSIIKEDKIIDVLAEVGAILLLFLIGIEFNLEKIKRLGLYPIIVFVCEFGLLFFIIYNFSTILGFDRSERLFLGIIFAITSTGIIVQFLKEMKMDKRKEVPLIVATSIVEDVVIVFLISFISSLAIGSLNPTNLSVSLIKSSVLLFAILIFFIKFLPKISNFVPDDEKIIFSYSLSLLMLFTFLTGLLGFSTSLGAFLAGSIIAYLPQAKKIENFVVKFSHIFIAIFFISFGFRVNFLDIVNYFPIILLFSFLVIVGKVLGVGLGYVFSGYDLRSSFFAGSAMIPVGEISLLISYIATTSGILPMEFNGIVASVAFITSLLLHPILKYNEKIYESLSKIVPDDLSKTFMRVSKLIAYYSQLVFGIKSFFVKHLEENLLKIIYNFFIFLLAISTLAYLYINIVNKDFSFYFSFLVLLSISFISFYNLIKILFSAFEKLSFNIKLKQNKEVIRFILLLFFIVLSFYISLIIEETTGIRLISLFLFLIIFIIMLNTIRKVTKRIKKYAPVV